MKGSVVTDPRCDITRVRRKMGMVFQSFNLFNNLTVLENVTAGPVKLLKMDKTQAEKEGMQLLKRVGLEDKAGSYPDELSGGQKQRAAIARAIAMKPEIMLFDEPTSETERKELKVSYTVSEASGSGSAVLTVSDTGCGIKAERLQDIFEPFYTTKGSSQGTGLGLSVVRSMVENAGGSIEVKSEEGRGTSFIMRFAAEESKERL